MSGYIGNIPTPQATQTRNKFTATAGQTSFATTGYSPNFLDVYLNGSFLSNGTDYLAGNGSDVVLTTGASAGDTLEVVAYSTFEVADVSGGVSGGGMFKGDNGTVGYRPGDIFRVNDQVLNADVTINADENASAAGPLTIADTVVLTVSGNLTVV